MVFIDEQDARTLRKVEYEVLPPDRSSHINYPRRVTPKNVGKISWCPLQKHLDTVDLFPPHDGAQPYKRALIYFCFIENASTFHVFFRKGYKSKI